ncbi:MAG TPA: carbohydrate ABC transporter permease [Phycisphaerae bacterium]|nr:carbohydrate ABC transporter permease [Phycisphaerae bacterium]
MQFRWRKYRRGRLSLLQATLVRAVLLIGAVTMAVPFGWMVCTALKDKRTMDSEPYRWLPKMPSADPTVSWSVDYLSASTPDFEDVVLRDFDETAAGDDRAARQGAGSLSMAVDFAADQTPDRTIDLSSAELPDTPVSMLAFWLRGDGSGHHLRVTVHGDGFVYRADDLPVGFEGWKEVHCYFRQEQFDPLGREVVPLRRDPPGDGGYVSLRSIRKVELTAVAEPLWSRAWQRWTYSFRKAWQSMPFGRFYLNSLFVSLAVTLGQVLTSALAGYAFARLRWPGRDKFFLMYLATMMIPAAVTIVPTFVLMKMLGWFDTYRALILPLLFSAYGTFMLRQFFLSLPADLEDAARIDGCGKLRVWLHVILPLSKPALATLATFTFLGCWGAFQWPLFATQSMHMKVLPIGLSAFQDKFSVQYNLMMAASLIVMVPTLAVFLFNQRFFTRGIQLSGMKE